MDNVVLAALIVVPPVLAYSLKSNAAVSFLALCGGFAAITLSGGDIEQLVGKTRITSLTSNNVALGLLVLPLLLTLLLTYRSVSEKTLRFLQLVPALCAGALLAVVAAPMINETLQTDLASSRIWADLQNAQTYIVSIGLLSSLLLIWIGSSSKSRSKKH